LEQQKFRVDKDYHQVLIQLFSIALPSPVFHDVPACPWLARGLATGKVLVEQGTDPLADCKNAIEQMNDMYWAIIYYYPESMHYRQLQLTCKIMKTPLIEPLYMHVDMPGTEETLDLCGKFPIMLVQNTALLNSPEILK
jgi:hypothetical protein